MKSIASTRDIHILYVEDNAILQYLMKKILLNYRVDVVESSLQALPLIESHHYDLLILDINLPGGMSGTELCVHIRGMNKYESTPILALTSYPLEQIKPYIHDKGFNDYIGKPFDSDYLRGKIKAFFNLP
jgi:CheY-like chemotaxis protein